MNSLKIQNPPSGSCSNGDLDICPFHHDKECVGMKNVDFVYLTGKLWFDDIYFSTNPKTKNEFDSAAIF